MDTKQLLGKRIKELIKKRGISQDRLAEMIGVEPTALSNIVTGRNYPLFSTLEKITSVLNISLEEIFKFKHLDDQESLKREIVSVLEKNPTKMQDFYKIARALSE